MLANPNSDERVHVLVVEDEPLSRIYTSNLVEDAGFVPIQAADADEAISILEARKDIRIVFTDINLPGSMDGLKATEPAEEEGEGVGGKRENKG